MFDKFIVIDKKIRLYRYKFEGTHLLKDSQTGKETLVQADAYTLVDLPPLNFFEEFMPIMTPLIIPEEFKQFDNMDWDGDWDSAAEMIKSRIQDRPIGALVFGKANINSSDNPELDLALAEYTDINGHLSQLEQTLAFFKDTMSEEEKLITQDQSSALSSYKKILERKIKYLKERGVV